MKPDAILKIGGSLSRGSGLHPLCREIAGLGERFRLLVVPGGGRFADQVRDAYARFSLDETTAHRMALLAMDQYGCLLGSLIEKSAVTADLAQALETAESGRVTILLPSMLVLNEDPLPHSWQVTSDTIAAWIAHASNCERLILLKDVDGLLAEKKSNNNALELIPALTVAQLARQSGGVDAYLCRFLANSYLEPWIINGLHPERIRELLKTGQTTGTRIRRS